MHWLVRTGDTRYQKLQPHVNRVSKFNLERHYVPQFDPQLGLLSAWGFV